MDLLPAVLAADDQAADLGQAAMMAWDVLRTAAGDDIAAWDTGAATAEIRLAGQA